MVFDMKNTNSFINYVWDCYIRSFENMDALLNQLSLLLISEKRKYYRMHLEQRFNLGS